MRIPGKLTARGRKGCFLLCLTKASKITIFFFRIRVSESGIGLQPLFAIGMQRGPIPISNDNSKYANNFTGVRKAGPPPGRRVTGSIDVLGGEQPKENIIQVGKSTIEK